METNDKRVFTVLLIFGLLMTGRDVDAQANVINGCVDSKGALRIVTSADACDKKETPIQWNKAGPTGPTGATGYSGPQGIQGIPGTNGRDADLCMIYAIVGKTPPPGSGLPCTPTVRFVDNNDGTITDNATGLMWEKKDECTNLANPHCRGNGYGWSLRFPEQTGQADGTLFTDFLEKINRSEPNINRKPYTDWRIPTIGELQTILNAGCPSAVCIDPIVGPNSASDYWSSTTDPANQLNTLNVFFFNTGRVDTVPKNSVSFARAVRGGQ